MQVTLYFINVDEDSCVAKDLEIKRGFVALIILFSQPVRYTSQK